MSTEVEAARSTALEEEACPACGRLPRTATSELAWRPAQHPRWPWVLLAVAAYVGVVFGSPAWGDYQGVVNAREMLRGTEGLGDGVVVDPQRYVVRHVKESATAWETYVLARRRWDRDVAAVSLAVAAALLGLSALVRRKLLRAGGPALPGEGAVALPNRGSRSAVALVAWALGEEIARSIFRVLLVVFCAIAISGLVQGAPPSWELVAETTHRTLDLIVGLSHLFR